MRNVPSPLYFLVQNLSIWERCIATVQRFREIFFTGIIDRSDPSSMMVGVTPTPNFPMPVNWVERSKELLGEHHLVSKTDLNVLQQIHANTLGKNAFFSFIIYDFKARIH